MSDADSPRTVAQRQHAPKGPVKGKDANRMGRTYPMGRCAARSKQTGEQCKQPVVAGATVCHYHGAAAPQVAFKAEERLRALQPPAVQKLGHWIDQNEFPTVSLGACKDVLDRTLGRPTEVVEVNQTITVTVTERLRRGRERLGESR